MAKVKVTRQAHASFGNVVNISNGLADLAVSLDYGPRIMHCALSGMENMFYVDAERKTLDEKFPDFDDHLILYGGHRIWISPEILPRCYHPDNLPVTFEKIDGGARFIAAEEKHNQIQKIMTVTMDENAPHINVLHSVRNTGMWDIALAPWCITMLDAGGVEVMPMPAADSGVLANRYFSFWAYTAMNDPRVYWGKDYITLRQDPKIEQPFKFGYNNEAGWGVYFNKGQAFVKFFEPTDDGIYPDNGCCFETYTNNFMLEQESLGEMVELSPDDMVTCEEHWELYKADAIKDARNETQLRAAVEGFVK